MVSGSRADVDILSCLFLEEPVVSFNLFRDKTDELAYRIKGVILDRFSYGSFIINVNGDLVDSLGSRVIAAVQEQDFVILV